MARVRDGAWARVAGLFVDRTEQVSAEVAEASAAASRLAGAQAIVAALEAKVADLDQLHAELEGAEAALRAARQATLEALVATDDPIAAELLTLIAAIADAESALARLDQRLDAGAVVADAVLALLGSLDAAIAVHSLHPDLTSGRLDERRFDEARHQLELVAPARRTFQDGVTEFGVALDPPHLSLDSVRSDGWLTGLSIDRRGERLAVARGASADLVRGVSAAQVALGERRRAVAQRRDELRAQRDAHVTPSDLRG